eukprot:1983721-Prymnesium_polylepis.1
MSVDPLVRGVRQRVVSRRPQLLSRHIWVQLRDPHAGRREELGVLTTKLARVERALHAVQAA